MVLGMHRSGTSAVAGILDALGVDFGPRLVPAAPDNNETGFWEHRDVVEVHECLLRALGSAWHDLRPLAAGWMQSAAARQAEADLVRIVRRDFQQKPRWGIKDPRMCRLLPLWSNVFAGVGARPKFLLVWRHPMDAAASLARRDGFSIARGLALWLSHMVAAERDTRHLDRAVLRYEDLLGDWPAVMAAAAHQCRLRLPTASTRVRAWVDQFLDPSLWHHRGGTAADSQRELPAWVAEGSDLIGRLTNGRNAAVESRLSALTMELSAATSLLGPEIAPAATEPEMAQLYLPFDGAYAEERSVRARFAANSPELVRFQVPAGALAPRAKLRLDPAANVGLVSIHRIVLRDTRGRTLMTAQGEEVRRLEVGGTSFRLPEEQDGLRVLSYGDDPQLFWPVPADLAADGALELEVALQVDRAGPWLPGYVRWLRAHHAGESSLLERAASEEQAVLQREIDALRAGATSLRAQCDALEQSARAREAELEAATRAKVDLQQQAAAADQQLAWLREEAVRRDEAAARAARELEGARAHSERLSRDMAAARNQTVELLRDREAERQRSEDLSRRMETLSREFARSSARAEALSVEAVEREARLAAALDELASIRGSSLFAAVRRLQALAARWAPIGTWRHRVVKRLGSALRLVATEGPAAGWRRTGAPPDVGRGEPALLAPAPALYVAIDSSLQERTSPTRSLVCRVSGWCYHSGARLRKLWFVADGRTFAADLGMERPDVHAAHYPQRDPHGYSLNSGFTVDLLLPPGPQREVPLRVRALLAGRTTVEQAAGTLHLREAPPTRERPRWAAEEAVEDQGAPEPLVAICMATYNPPLALFRRQVDSLLEQTHRNWICIINDDCSRPDIYEQMRMTLAGEPRLRLYRNAQTLGFYHNFEAALRRVPPEAEFVCMADQDDVWHRHKLSSLRQAFGPEILLAYSDMNIRDETGALISSTYWTTRRNNYTNLESLLLANTVTGAASMFRRGLLEDVLPFPARIGDSFHDHWLACVALTKARLAYVDRPLHDYIQHGTQVLGHSAPRPRGPLAKVSRLVAAVARVMTSAAHLRQFVQKGRLIYWNDVSRVKLIAATLLERVPEAPAAKRTLLRRYARLDRSPFVLARLLLGAVRELAAAKETTVMGELYLLHGILGESAFRLRQILRRPRRTAVKVARAMLGESRAHLESGFSRVELIEQKVAPLSLELRAGAPKRVNLLIPTVDFQVFFGGYIAKFHLALRLSRAGYRVRVVVVDPCEVQPANWRRQFQEFEQLADVVDAVEFEYAFDRSRALEVSGNDRFVATTWWTAHIAHHARRQLNPEPFLYLIQEYEPFTFAMSTYAALAMESYSFPHHAMFSTELLRDHFKQSRTGVFSPEASADVRALCFRNAITDVGPMHPEDLDGRWPRRVLFYARPEPHASRNMFEMGFLALSRAIEQGAFDQGPWEFYGIGTSGSAQHLPLPGGRALHLLPRVNQREYARLLRAHDLGLSLMLTPHPSLVPIEMASAGMVTVTNTFGCKTAESLQSISANLVPAPPSVTGVADALRCAVSRLDDAPGRARASAVRWSRNWEEAFPPSLVQALAEILGPP